MPGEDDEQGHSASLLRALIWAGVGLAPVAAVVVLLGGSDGSVRFGVLLIAVCVVLIGASMLIRSDPVLLRMDVEDRVAEEVDLLREELREQIAAASRATHHRAQSLEEGLAHARPPASGQSGSEPGGVTGGRAAVRAAPVAAVAVTRPPVDATPAGAGGGVSAAAAPVPPRAGAAPVPRPGGVAPRPGGAARVAQPGGIAAPPPGIARPVPQQRPAAAAARSVHPPAGSPKPAPPSPQPYGRYGTGRAAGPDPAHQPDVDGSAAERSGRRRADVTAIDLGYTGRRHSGDEAGGRGDDVDDGRPDAGPDQYGPRQRGSAWRGPAQYGPAQHGSDHGDHGDHGADPLAEEYDWRQSGSHW
jgi:hypothetical protein